MSKLPSPIREVARVLDLVPFLDSHPGITLKDLAETFATTEKEMQSTLITLSMCGTPGGTPYDLIEVFYDDGFVTVNQHDVLNLQRSLSEKEIAYLLLGLDLLASDLKNDRSDLEVVANGLRKKLSSISGDFVSATHDSPSPSEEVVHKAMKSRHQVILRYRNALNQVRQDVHVAPIDIQEKGGQKYLVAHEIGSGITKRYRLDRIETIEISDTLSEMHSPTEKEANPDVYTIRILERQRRYREIFSISHIAADGTAQCEAFSQEWMIAAIVAAGGDIELLEPAHLRSQIAARASEILQLYRD